MNASLKYWRKEYDAIKNLYGNADIVAADGISIEELDFVDKATHDSPFIHKDYKKILKRQYNHISKFVIDNNVELYIVRNPNVDMQIDIDRIANRISASGEHFDKHPKMRIIIYPTDWKKSITNGQPLTVKNINSGSTGMIDDIQYILIWRCEEIYKVLLHELIHRLDLDYYRSSNKEVSEAITEALAEIYHIIFTLIEQEEPFEKFVHYFGENLKYGIETCARLQDVDWGDTNVEGYFFNRVALLLDFDKLTEFWKKKKQNIRIDQKKLEEKIKDISLLKENSSIRMYYND